MDSRDTPDEIVFYETSNGKISVGARFTGDNAWLTREHIAELFRCSPEEVSAHLRCIYDSGELELKATTKESVSVRRENLRVVRREVRFYALDVALAVGYRVHSERGAAFRAWATDKLKSYIFKGFAVDSERFKTGSKFDARFFEALMEEINEIRASERMVHQKITDIYQTAVDYSSGSAESETFFAVVQDRLYFAITGCTAAEIISSRANHQRYNMGLTAWLRAPIGKIFLSDTKQARNYLSKDEILHLNRIVNKYIDYAEFQAARGKLMYMKDWAQKFDAFLKFSGQEILGDSARVTYDVALALAEKEYSIFKTKQDREYKSDFDKLLEQLPAKRQERV